MNDLGKYHSQQDEIKKLEREIFYLNKSNEKIKKQYGNYRKKHTLENLNLLSTKDIIKRNELMKQLGRGSETTARLNLLLTQCKFRSDNTISALHDYLVKGYSLVIACESNDIKNKGNLERDILKVNEVAQFVVDIEQHDWNKTKKTSEQIEKDKISMRKSLEGKDIY